MSLKSGPNIREIGMDAIPKRGSGLPSIMLDHEDQDKMALWRGRGTRRVQNGPKVVWRNLIMAPCWDSLPRNIKPDWVAKIDFPQKGRLDFQSKI